MSCSNYNLISTSDVPEDQPGNHNTKICGICNLNTSKYCCPRCEILYCSLDCYKSESHTICSEDFYRDCVNEELANLNADDDTKKKTIEILKRIQNGENLELAYDENEAAADSDDEVADDLEQRIKDLDLNNADEMWNVLTEDEKNEFRALCNAGDVTSIIPPWEPWWMYSKEEKLVEEVNEKNMEDVEALRNCPGLKPVVEFGKLTTVQPSATIKMNIANVLTAYAFIMRYFNGELEPIEGTICFLMICGNLGSNTNYDDLATAVESVAQKCLQTEFIETDKESLEVMKHDTFLILQGPSHDNRDHYSKAALSHLHKVFGEAKKTEKGDKKSKEVNKNEFSKIFPDHKQEHLPKLEVVKLKKCMKKLEFYLSYIESYGMDFE
ncbi:zinc finger HIT domain-containing protein 2 [Plodia interpunctella]|uniref:zinc finger HIT domain-containing protein 2 n=1 Tax=Plodia interpunctella TaxID=58824 RepID=UPI002368E3FE|nr:zinc finger HIT domain-containing protein 2 [Plodia interpunctella]